jgi:hypothetical protein
MTSQTGRDLQMPKSTSAFLQIFSASTFHGIIYQVLLLFLNSQRYFAWQRSQAIKTTLATFSYFLLSFSTFMNVAAKLRKENQIRKRRRGISKKKENHKVLFIYTVLVGVGLKSNSIRRFWVDIRSSDWITNLLNGQVLQEERFQRVFRKSKFF